MVGVLVVALMATPAQAPPAWQVAWAREAWAGAGRARVGSLLGIRWEPRTQRWAAEEDWPGVEDASATAYFVEPVLSPVLALAEATSDKVLFIEVAGYFLVALGRFETLEKLRAKSATAGVRSNLDPFSPASVRVLPWSDPRVSRPGMDECALCQLQFLYPAARAVRLVSLLWPHADAPAVVDSFVEAYIPLLVEEHVWRLGYVAPSGFPVREVGSHSRVVAWEYVASGRPLSLRPWQVQFGDRDLWLVATAAELLGARDRAGRPLTLAGHRADLERLVQAGVARIRQELDQHPSTVDRAGRIVGSVGYGEGGWDGFEDFAFAGDTGASVPVVPLPPRRTGWDMSHLTRLPVALRALWDTRAAHGTGFPDPASLAALGRQYAYVAFTGELDRPRFRNFFDGGDGWYRVGYAGRTGSGMPPSRYCNVHPGGRSCVGTWAARGWGLLAFASAPIDTVQQSMIALASASDPDAVAFRDRYYYVSPAKLSFEDVRTAAHSSLLLMALIAELSLGASDATRH